MGTHRVIPLYKEEGLDTRQCSYLPERQRSSVIYTNNNLSPDLKLRQEFQRAAVESGFELMGGPHRVTINNCSQCRSCVQVRVKVRDFNFDSHQSRVIRRHSDLIVDRKRTGPDDGQYELYAAYFKARFPHRIDDLISKKDFDAKTGEWLKMQTLRLPEKAGGSGGEMVGALYYEDCGSALILGNQFYNRDMKKRGFGKFAILSLIQMAKERGDVDYIYLGPWVKGSDTLDYKKDFHPLEGFDGHAWIPLDPAQEGSTTPPGLDIIFRLILTY